MNVVDEVRAALIWTPRKLREGGSEAALQFIDAMNLTFHPELTDAPRLDHPLSTAAHGLSLELEDHWSEALELYELLIASSDPLVRILGLSLAGWTGEGREESLAEALELLIRTQLDDSDLLRAVCCKLLALSLDIGAIELAERCLDAALSHFDDQSRIAGLLRQLGSQLFGRQQRVYFSPTVDSLESEQAIESMIAGVGRRSMVEAFEETFRSPWRPIFRFGDRNLHDISAAEMQALWAGAVWLVSEARRMLSIQLLSGAGERAETYEYGLAYWSLAKGENLGEVADFAEAKFDAGSASRLFSRHLRSGLRFAGKSAYYKLCQALWHELPDHVAEQLLRETSPQANETEQGRVVRSLWCSLSVTHRQAWHERFGEMSDEEVASLVPAMQPWMVQRLGASAADRFYRVAVRLHLQELDPERSGNDRLIFLLAEADERSRPLPDGFAEALEDEDLFWLGERGAALVGPERLARRVNDLLSAAESLAASGRGGMEMMFATDPFFLLGALASMQEVPPDAVGDVLAELSMDTDLPSRYRSGALLGLRLYCERHDLSSAAPIFGTKIRAGRPEIGAHASFTMLRVRHLRVLLAAGGLPEPWELAELARDADAAVRDEALSAVAGLEDETLVSTCMGGALYDPTPDVYRHALELCTTSQHLVDTPVLRLAKRRIVQLAASGGARDRAAAARAAKSLLRREPGWSSAEDVLESSRKDRSWLVRDAASQAV